MRLTHFLTQLSECWVASARSCWDQVGCVRSRVRKSVRSARYWASASIAPPPFSLGVSSEKVESISIEEVYDVRKQRGDDDRKPYTGSYSFPYIATWASRHDGQALLKQVMSRVQVIAHRVIAGMTAEDQRAAAGPDLPADDRLAA